MSDPITWTNERRRLGELHPWPINPRQIKKDQAKRLSDSLDRYGQVDIIAVEPDNEVVNGHQRLNVWMQEHGADYEVDVRVASRKLSDDEKKRLTVYLHQGAVGEWDFDLLANNFELGDLLEWGFDAKNLDMDLWQGDAPEDPGAQIDRAEELREQWGVELGQLWRIPSKTAQGEHRIMCGDCTDRAVVERVMQGEKAGAVVTDPPYGINREGIENDDPEGLRELFDGCLSVMPVENAVVIAFQSPRLFPEWLDAIRAYGHKFERQLWMHKSNDVTNSWRGWMMNGEPIFISSTGIPKWSNTDAVQDCYVITHDVNVKIAHKSVKPLPVVQNLITHTTGIVYDPFLGSGTTLVACERLGRLGRGIEISPAYVAVSLQRLADMGLEPALVIQEGTSG